MLARQAIISREDAGRILAGLAAVAGELRNRRIRGPGPGAKGQGEAALLDPQTPTPDPQPLAAWEDVHTWVEGRVRELVGEAAGRLHTARSRNDQVALDLRMFDRDAILDQIDGLAALQGALLGLATRNQDTLIAGYTHLQRAQPVLLAHHLLAYGEMLQRDAERLLDCYRRTNVLPLGSGALAGVPYPIDRPYVARLLAFPEISRNSMDAVADRDFAVEHVAALALVAAHLSRLAEELVLWSTAEFGFVRIGDTHATGSSMMPQKRNPDVAELVRGKTGRVYGRLVGLLTIFKGLPLTYNRDLQEDKEPLFDAVDTVLDCTLVMAEMLHGIELDREAMARAAGSRFTTATDYADYLAKKGMPFREAHAVIGQLVLLCEQRECDLADLGLDELRVASPLFEADAVGLTAQRAVAAREVPGGTGPRQVAAALVEAQSRLEALTEETSRRRAALPSLERLLNEAIDA
jgi:argininosuccinate lyase